MLLQAAAGRLTIVIVLNLLLACCAFFFQHALQQPQVFYNSFLWATVKAFSVSSAQARSIPWSQSTTPAYPKMVLGKTPVNKKKKNWNRLNKVKARSIKRRKRAEQKRKDVTAKNETIGASNVAAGLMDVELTLQDKETLALKAVERRLRNRKPRGLSKKKTKAVIKQVRLRAKENTLSTESRTAKSRSKFDVMIEV